MNAGRPPRRELPEFLAALEAAHASPKKPQPYCDGKAGVYADYIVPPEPKLARKLCEPCPLVDLCYASALSARPAWGIRGGVSWTGGRQDRLRRKPNADELIADAVEDASEETAPRLDAA